MVSRQFDEISSGSGDTWKNATITEIDSEGMRFTHASGVARLAFADMTPEWRERLLWSPDEAPESPEEPSLTPEELERRKKLAEILAEQRAEDERKQAIRDARTAYRVTHSNHTRTLQAAQRARAKIGGSERSVPGSLRTWEEQAASLDAQAAKLLKLHEQAKARLRELNPDDLLLRGGE